ncbi:MAG: CsgG/HfaB family protein [Candidatus Baltobacteraceae bacterium]
MSAPAVASAAGTGPSVAVLDFSTKGLTSNAWGNFEPGVALSDLLTDQIVKGGKFDVLDRKNLDSTLSEHSLAASGEVDSTSAITAGRLVGARYLISGNILQLDQTGRSGGGAGSFLPGLAGAVAGAVKTDRTTLRVAVRVVDARTGRIVQSFTDEQTEKATSFAAGAFSGYTAGGYSNEQFVNSSMGHLINSEATKIAADLDPTKFTSGAATAAISGHVLSVDGANVILNVGSAKGVTVGMYFDVVKIKRMKDPDSGKTLTVNENVGTIEVTSVSADTAVAKLVSGTASARYAVQSQA